MWVRQWRSNVSRANSDACLEFLQTVAVPRHKKAEGNLRAHVLRIAGELADEFRLFSYWHSLEAIQAFTLREETTILHSQAEHGYRLSVEPDILIYQPFDLDDYDFPPP